MRYKMSMYIELLRVERQSPFGKGEIITLVRYGCRCIEATLSGHDN